MCCGPCPCPQCIRDRQHHPVLDILLSYQLCIPIILHYSTAPAESTSLQTLGGVAFALGRRWRAISTIPLARYFKSYPKNGSLIGYTDPLCSDLTSCSTCRLCSRGPASGPRTLRFDTHPSSALRAVPRWGKVHHYGVVADVVHSRISSRWLFWLKVWMIWSVHEFRFRDLKQQRMDLRVHFTRI